MNIQQANITSRIVHSIMNSKIPLFIIVLSIIAGLLALHVTSREEEPQIVVPMIDVVVETPGVSAR